MGRIGVIGERGRLAEIEWGAGHRRDLAGRDRFGIHRQVAIGRHAQHLHCGTQVRVAGQIEIWMMGKVQRRSGVAVRFEIQLQAQPVKLQARTHLQIAG